MNAVEKFRRAVDRAVNQNIQLFESSVGILATSATNPLHLYKVDVHSCECLGFQHHGQCKHNAALVMGVALSVASE